MSWPDSRLLHWEPTLQVPSDDGTRIAVEVLGDGHPGPTAVFVHGWTFSSRSWHYQRQLAERWRLVLMDHRGHGESEAGGRDLRTIDQLGADLYAVVQATSGDRDVVLVGHSMGGMTVMALAAQHPELFGDKVKAVALIDTSPGGQPENTYRLPPVLAKLWLQRFAAELTAMREDPVTAERRRRPGSRLSLAVSRWLNFGVKPDPRLVRFTEAMSAATPAEVVGDFSATLQTHDKLAALATLGSVSTLVVVGDRDRLTPPSHARAIAAAVPGARLLQLRGAGHCPMLEQPDTVNAVLSQLLTDVATAGERPASVPLRRKQKVAS